VRFGLIALNSNSLLSATLMAGLAALHFSASAQVAAPAPSPVNLKDAVERAVLQNPEV